MDLPIFNCGYKVDYVVEVGAVPHTHTTISEIIQTFDSFGTILINGKLYNMQKNGLYFIHGPATHMVVPDDLNRYNHSIISLNTVETERLCAQLHAMPEYNTVFTAEGGTFCPLSPENAIKADSLFLNIHNILNNPDNTLKYAQLSVQLIELLKIGFESRSSESNYNSKITDILAFISDNALTRITIDDICKETHMSKYHLCRIFKEHIGVTIGEFLKHRRLAVAKQLLSETNDSMTKIAHICGFTDASIFSKTFSKEFKMKPSEFRAKHR